MWILVSIKNTSIIISTHVSQRNSTGITKGTTYMRHQENNVHASTREQRRRLQGTHVQSSPFYSLSQPHHVTAFHPSSGDNHQSTGWLSERTQGKAKIATWNTISYIYVPGPSTLSYLSRIFSHPPPSFLCCPRTPSHHLSSPTSVYRVPAHHLLMQSTPFWPCDTHPFFPHAQTHLKIKAG